MSGPVPKRSDGKVRHVKAQDMPLKVDAVESQNPYDAPLNENGTPRWEPEVMLVFESFAKSGQSQFYEPSDWAQVHILMEALDRELKPQFVGMQTLPDGSNRPMTKKVPIKGATLNAIRSWMAALLASEGDRRRIQLELERANRVGPTAASNISEGQAKVLDLKARLSGGGK
jgi:hypothetical protein